MQMCDAGFWAGCVWSRVQVFFVQVACGITAVAGLRVGDLTVTVWLVPYGSGWGFGAKACGWDVHSACGQVLWLDSM